MMTSAYFIPCSARPLLSATWSSSRHTCSIFSQQLLPRIAHSIVTLPLQRGFTFILKCIRFLPIGICFFSTLKMATVSKWDTSIQNIHNNYSNVTKPKGPVRQWAAELYFSLQIWTYLDLVYARKVTLCTFPLFLNLSDNRDKAPGQRECDYSIDNINKCIRDIEQASLAAVGQTLPCRDDISMEVSSSSVLLYFLSGRKNLMRSEVFLLWLIPQFCAAVTNQALQEQLTSSVQEIGHLIDPVSTAARGEAAQLGHKVLVWPYIPHVPSGSIIKTAWFGLWCSHSSFLPGNPAGQLLWAAHRRLGGPGFQTAWPPAADDHPGPEQDPGWVCSADAVRCQRRRRKPKGTAHLTLEPFLTKKKSNGRFFFFLNFLGALTTIIIKTQNVLYSKVKGLKNLQIPFLKRHEIFLNLCLCCVLLSFFLQLPFTNITHSSNVTTLWPLVESVEIELFTDDQIWTWITLKRFQTHSRATPQHQAARREHKCTICVSLQNLLPNPSVSLIFLNFL